MADFGINDQGFTLKRFDDIRADLIPILEQIEDPVTGEFLNLDDENDVVAQIVNALMDNNAKTWEILQDVYTQFDPSSAVKASLESLVQLNGITRQTGSFSTVAQDLVGDPSTLIEAGKQISNGQEGAPIWLTTEDVTIGGSGTESTILQASEKGAIPALSGTLTTILTPVPGWTSTTNTADADLGQPVEDDPELRARRDDSTEVPSVAPVEAIYGNLLNLEGVEFVRVLINNTLSVDSRGIDPKSIAAVVVGGDDLEIAETLFLRSPAGAGFFGNTSEDLVDVQGETYTIEWVRPDPVDIEVEVDVNVISVGEFPSDGADQITADIIVYAQEGAPGLGIEPQAGFERFGFVPGGDVIRSRLMTPINATPGHSTDLATLLINKVGDSPAAADIPIAFDEQSNFESANITINVSIPP